MKMTDAISRACGKCELCSAETELSLFEVPASGDRTDNDIALCGTCQAQIADTATLDVNHWRCLNDSMWSTVPAVQVMAARMLKELSSETWAQDLLDMMYLDEDTQAWVDAANAEAALDADAAPTLDSNGAQLAAGDTVVIIKDLNVKGTSFVAKRGTAVRNIALTNNPEHIEGRVNGTRIVILSCYVKKS
ncbi:PhnA domain-containing protein [Shewanella zhangzhouensis]|nr:alkylphosphonate utilization protein [Shewanella zhangzhouensis]QYK07108.1 PhnA domain-containing protein [Shewanella zhangzhouensis]